MEIICLQDTERGPQPSKNYLRYATRQKRADAKRALKDLLFKSGSTKMSFQDDEPIWGTHETSNENSDQENDSHGSSKQSRSKKASKSASRRKQKQECFDDFDANPETIFQATFGGRCFTWSFRSWEDSHFQNSTAGFEWRDHNPHWTKNRRKVWDTTSENEDENYEPCVVGSRSDRTILGLPPTGPLKMEDVKNAFRLSALKWHPDKHQGPSQTMAEEKFKVCVDAYKSLCNALSST
ncbi:DnaJ domain [Macleaya cordata]|uniref:DnaJ domain n=1 Tax=Macleaya cordata TaxID=56857 RepID=A0A200QBK9_MACCD|nr:DnaJ domain [Macleaya cordata]